VKFRCKLKSTSAGALAFLRLGWAGAAVRRFQITPQVLCEGESARASWDVHGKPVMTFQAEPIPNENHCTPRGKEAFVFTLVAQKSGTHAERQIEVLQLHPGGTEPIVFSTSRLQGSEVVASGEKNPALWPGRVHIESVAACDSRAIQVRHAGRAALLAASGAPSDALAGTPVTGEWELRSPLTPQEQRDPALRPKELEIIATFSCTRATP